MPKSKQCSKTHIEKLNHEGRGLARIDGKTTFIDYALPEETVHFQYTRQHRRFDEGIALDIENPSPHRVTPNCPHFGVCGGCKLQHLNPEQQILHKQAVLLELLEQSTQTKPLQILPPLTGPEWAYRHKARLSVKYVHKKEKLLIGFRERNGRYVADLTQCLILHPGVGTKLEILAQLIQQLDITFNIPQIEIAVGEKNTALIFRHLKPLTSNDIARLKQFGTEHNFYIFLQPQGPNSITLLTPEQTSEFLNYTLPNYDLEFLFHPTDFTQVNPSINRKLISQALELLDLKSDDTVLDLFCGLGNFTLPIAKQCKTVIGVEGSEAMVKRAQMNANHNHIHNTQFFAADLSLEQLDNRWQKPVTKLLIDPPRSGAAQITKILPKLKPKRLVYISCNPITLARDAVLILEHGFQLTSCGVIDMFPHTAHVESIACFDSKL